MSQAAETTHIRLRELHASMVTACVTGTNGKTTTTSMIEAIVALSGEPAARVTTVGAWVDGALVSEHATPEAFLRTVERAVAAGVKTIAVETTSQALMQGFAARWPPRVAVFTNLSRDHFDVHETGEAYLAAKAQLFMSLLPAGTAVLNAADPASALLDEVTPAGARRAAYAARPVEPVCAALPLVLSAREVTVDRGGTHVDLEPSPLADALGGRLDLRVIGAVHAENALAAAVAADALGYAPEVISRALAGFAGVPGRFERVCERPLVVVDFAHTPDALERTLSLARGLVRAEGGRVVAVFGCGGDRDQGKRAEMGRVAASGADQIVLTNDNPRGESPDRILDMIEQGIAEGGSRAVERIPDRARAIEAAIHFAAEADIVVIAGKGHESTQTLDGLVTAFSDQAVARDVIASKAGKR
jgi:UDP-N-acetylmuramoyl-L-alanyl-D-glutamate--2,6-diaminopimelate ligase